MKTNFKRILTLFAWISVILFILRLLISIKNIENLINEHKFWELTYNLVSFSSEAILVSGIILFLYDKFLWKIANFWHIPILLKKYEGVFISSYDNAERHAELIVKQTFLSVKIKMKTSESWSYSINESLDYSNGINILTYTYFNQPDLKLYDRSKMHFGTATLNCDDVLNLSGNYYTDRKTVGSMNFVPKE